jgi:predicted metal-dependent HD superfamily phosphohydrolase
VLKQDNEQQSAELAARRLKDIGFPEQEIERCIQFILATQHHKPADAEINLFTDADLGILGAAPAAYAIYTQQIRQEYSIYPDAIYKPGRKKVLQHFLAMPQVYKTEAFSSRLEVQARANLTWELTTLL